MRNRLSILAVRIFVRLGLNLNYLVDPVTAWKRGEPLRRPKDDP